MPTPLTLAPVNLSKGSRVASPFAWPRSTDRLARWQKGLDNLGKISRPGTQEGYRFETDSPPVGAGLNQYRCMCRYSLVHPAPLSTSILTSGITHHNDIMMLHLVVTIPALTHNPWHHAQELSEDGKERIARELTEGWLDWLPKHHPDTPSIVMIGGRSMGGYYPR